MKVYKIILSLVFSFIYFIPLTYAQSNEPPIKVGLLSNQNKVVISADTDFEVIDANTGDSIEQFLANEKVIVSAENKEIVVSGKKTQADQINILMLAKDSEHYIEVNKRHYRGNIDIHITKGNLGLTVVNTLPIEQYLYGVISKEISPAWPVEAVKAQVIAARSYALANKNKYQRDGYDVCATVDSQVYGGHDSEDIRANKAVDNTYGQVLTYQGKIISAFFHSSSGGYTEDSENVWGTYQPYLRGVIDYDQMSPQYRWEKRLTINELETALDKAGYNIGALQAIELSPLESQPMNVPDRGISGRVKTLTVIGNNGTIELAGTKLRSMLNLKSTLFDINIGIPVQKNVEVKITGIDKVKGNKSNPVGETNNITKEKIHYIRGFENEIITFSGYGWGHGLGLSQWGAKAMAEKGPQDDATYYKEILKHYYKGVDIKQAY